MWLVAHGSDQKHAGQRPTKFLTALLRYTSRTVRVTHLVYTVQWPLVQSQRGAVLTTIDFGHFTHRRKKPRAHWGLLPLPPLSPALSQAIPDLFNVSVDLPVLEASHARNHTIWGLLRLAAIMWHNVSKSHPCCNLPSYVVFLFKAE